MAKIFAFGRTSIEISRICGLLSEFAEIAAIETDAPNGLAQFRSEMSAGNGVVSINEEDSGFAEKSFWRTSRKLRSSSPNAMVQEWAAVPNTGIWEQHMPGLRIAGAGTATNVGGAAGQNAGTRRMSATAANSTIGKLPEVRASRRQTNPVPAAEREFFRRFAPSRMAALPTSSLS